MEIPNGLTSHVDIPNSFTSVNQTSIPTPPQAQTLPPPPPPPPTTTTSTTTTSSDAILPQTTETTPTTATAGTKRKRSPKNSMKFYAVRVGKEPGIYHSWSECLDQVRGFPKAAFKSFTSLTEAEAFLNDDATATSGGGANGYNNGRSDKFYGVREGRVPGVYASWQEVLEQITGWKGPKHKVFKTRVEAEAFVNEGRAGMQQGGLGLMNNGGDAESIDGATADTLKSKKPKPSKKSNGLKDDPSNSPGGPAAENDRGSEYPPGEGPLPPNAEDNFDQTIVLDQTSGLARYKTAPELSRTKYQASRPIATAPIRIYTDGSTLFNGQAEKAIGGVGVYFGPKDGRNVSEPLMGSKQTNQRAELTAVLRALEVGPRDRRIVILSDSNYAIKCVTEWFWKWRTNNWHNSSNKPVENKDLVVKITDMLEERMRLNAHRMTDDYYDDEEEVLDDVDGGGIPEEVKGPWEKGPAGVKFTWVKGHAKDEGNSAADELAVNGARVARELGEEVVLD